LRFRSAPCSSRTSSSGRFLFAVVAGRLSNQQIGAFHRGTHLFVGFQQPADALDIPVVRGEELLDRRLGHHRSFNLLLAGLWDARA
jgi:hypothetical protein